MRGNFGLKLQSSPKLPHIHARLYCSDRFVSRFLSRRFHPKSRRLFPFYFSNITLKTDLLTFGVTGAVFKIAGEMRRLQLNRVKLGKGCLLEPSRNLFQMADY